MVKNLVKKLIPTRLKVLLSKIEDFLRFDLYAYWIVKSKIDRALTQRQQPSQYLLILAPARSGSSLLVNVLNGHPEVTGYGESHVSYTTAVDLDRLIYRTAALLDDFDPAKHRYVMDKMVWNYPISDTILKNKNIKFLFLLRDPAATCVSSLKCPSVPAFQNGDSWMRYYQKRLAWMEKVAIQINEPSRCLTLQYEELLGNTDKTLALFQSFLETTTPFSDHYTALSTSGRFKYGDSSSSIMTGKILRGHQPKRTLNEKILSLDKQQVIHGFQEHCIDTLSRYTRTMNHGQDTPPPVIHAAPDRSLGKTMRP